MRVPTTGLSIQVFGTGDGDVEEEDILSTPYATLIFEEL
jgi:hypothetical protein